MKEKNKRLWNRLAPLGVLFAGFLLCRFAFFGLHGMKEWPLDLLLAGLVVVTISLITKKQMIAWFTSAGYLLGFFVGVLFHSEGFDPGGGRTDNLWILWTVTFMVCIVAGAITETVMKWRRLLKNKRTAQEE